MMLDPNTSCSFHNIGSQDMTFLTDKETSAYAKSFFRWAVFWVFDQQGGFDPNYRVFIARENLNQPILKREKRLSRFLSTR